MQNNQLQICVSQDCNLDRLIEKQEDLHQHYLLGHEVLLEKNFIQIIEVLQKQRQNNFINYSQQRLIQLLQDYEKLYNNNIKIFIDDVFELFRRDIKCNTKVESNEVQIQEQILSKNTLNILVDLFNGNQNTIQKNKIHFDQQLQQLEYQLQELDNEFQSIFKSYLDIFINMQKTTFQNNYQHEDQLNNGLIQNQIFDSGGSQPILEMAKRLEGSDCQIIQNDSEYYDSQAQLQQQQQQQQNQQDVKQQDNYHDYYGDYDDDYHDYSDQKYNHYQQYEEQQEEMYRNEYEKQSTRNNNQEQISKFNLFEDYSDEECQNRKQQQLEEYQSKLNKQLQNNSQTQRSSSAESQNSKIFEVQKIVKYDQQSLTKKKKSKIQLECQYDKKQSSYQQKNQIQSTKDFSNYDSYINSNAYVDYELSDRISCIQENPITSVKQLLKLILTTNRNVPDTQRLLYFKIKLLNQEQQMRMGMINLSKSSKKSCNQYLLKENGQFFKGNNVITQYQLNLLKYKTFELGISKENKIEFIGDDKLLVAYPIANYQQYTDNYQFIIYIKNIELTIL